MQLSTIKTGGFKAHRREILLLAMIFISLFMVNSVAAADLGTAPIKSYNPTEESILLISPDLTKNLADIKLETPRNYFVPRGYNMVLKYTINVIDETYTNPLKSIEFQDMSNGYKTIDRTFDYKIKVNKSKVVDDYKESCNTLGNGTKSCSYNKVGSHTEYYDGWDDFDVSKITKGKYDISVWTDVKAGDKIEWIANYYDVRLTEWASWTEAMNTSLMHYYRLDNLGVNVTQIDTAIISSNNLTANGSSRVTGKLGNASYFDKGIKDYLVSQNNFEQTGNFNFSFALWFKKASNVSGDNTLFDMGTAGGGVRFQCTMATNVLQCDVSGSLAVPLGNVYDLGWHLIVMNYSSAGLGCAILDNNSVVCDSGSLNLGTGKIWVGKQINNLISNFNGTIDEFIIWNRTLNYDEMIALWNNGNGLSLGYSDLYNPSVTLNSPENYFNTSVPTTTFNVTALDYNIGGGIANVSLYIDNSLEMTNTSGVNGTYIFTKLLSSGLHNWSILAYSVNGTSNQSQTRILNLTISSPNITLIAPINYFNTTWQNISFSANITDNLMVQNVTFYLDGVLNETNTSQINGTYVFDRYLNDGNHNWSILAYDNESNPSQSSTRQFNINTTPFIQFIPPTYPNMTNLSNGNETIPMYVNVSTNYFKNITYGLYNENGTAYLQTFNNQTLSYNFTNIPDAHYHYNVSVCTTTNKCNVTETRHINHDTRPPTLTINTPQNTTYVLANLTTADNVSLTIDWTSADEHIDSCWYAKDGGANITTTCNATSIRYFNYGVHFMDFYSNDTLNNLAVQRVYFTLSFNLFQNSIIYNNNTFSGAQETFSIIFNKSSSLTLNSVQFLYNNVSYPVVFSSTSITQFLNNSIIVPAVPNVPVLYGFYWSFVFSDGTTINTTNLTQQVNPITFDCTPTNITSASYLVYSDLTEYQVNPHNYNNRDADVDYVTVDTKDVQNSNTYINFNYVNGSTYTTPTQANHVYSYTGHIFFNANPFEPVASIDLISSHDATYFKNFYAYGRNFTNITTSSFVVLDYTMLDEETLEDVNGTIETLFYLYSFGTKDIAAQYNGTMQYNSILTNNSICLSNITSDYNFAYEIRHWVNTSTYFTRFRNIQYGELDNSTIPINITLYNLLIASGQVFTLRVSGADAAANEGLLVEIQRQYIPAGDYKTIESVISATDGSGLVHMIPVSVMYNFIVSKDGVIIGRFIPQTVSCVNSVCSLPLNINQASITVPNWTSYGNIRGQVSVDNSTYTVHFAFSSTDSSPHNVNMVVQKNGNGTVICNTSLLTTSGDLQCVIPAVFRNETFVVKTYSDGTWLSTTVHSLLNAISSADYYGVDIIIELLMYSTLVLMMLSNPILIVIGAILGLVFGITLVTIGTGNWLTLMSIAVYFIAAGIIIIWQINRKS